MQTPKKVRWTAMALFCAVAAGTAGFHFIERWSWFDGLYMVVTTFTTIGYQEVHPLSHPGRVFNLILIAVGVSLVFLNIGFMTQALLEFEFGSLSGRRKMERDITRLSGHYIICGAGRVGRSAARELARKQVPFVIIDANEARVEKYSASFLIFAGDATKEDTLRRARIEHAAGLVAATTTDATNLYTVLTARGMNAQLKIIARVVEEDAEKHMLTSGANAVVSPYTFAGTRIAQTFLHPNVVSFLDAATTHLGMDLEINEVLVAPESRLAGLTLAEACIPQLCGAIVLAIKHDRGMHFNPASTDRIAGGDRLIAMGEPAQLRALEQSACPPA
jgi:voltage-gated potassium channel